MRTLLLIAALSLSSFAFAQGWGSEATAMQPAGNDFYNQKVAQEQIQSSLVLAANQPSAQVEEQSETQPGSMAVNLGAGDDFYNQKLAKEVDQSLRIKASIAPSAR
jgi:hypothetical protein